MADRPQRRAAATRLGTMIGRFRLVELQGSGGVGTVYRAIDTTLERPVAVKVLHPESRLNAEIKERFRREARVLSQLEHPNICQIHDFIEDGLDEAIVLEFIEGQSLARYLQSDHSFQERLDVACSVASVLCSVHKQGILHRDLKPQNIMVKPDGTTKVLDFGLARIEDTEQDTVTLIRPSDEPANLQSPVPTESPELTRRGGVMGTPAFMSPEQARGEQVGPASDLYSFGLLLQTLFSDSPPYADHLSTAELLERSQRGDVEPPQGMRRDLLELTLQLLAASPAQRPTAEQALASLHRAAGRNSRRLRRSLAAASLLILTLLGSKGIADLAKERRRAVEAEGQAEATIDFLVRTFGSVRVGDTPLDEITVKQAFEEAVRTFPEQVSGDAQTRVRAINALGEALTDLGLYAEVEALLQHTRDIEPSDLDQDSLDGLLELRSQVASFRGDLELAGELLEQRIPLNPPERQGSLTIQLANNLKARDRLEEAEELAKRGLEMARTADLTPTEMTGTGALVAYQALGNILFSSHKPEEAREVFEEGYEFVSRRFGERDFKSSLMLEGLVEVAMSEGRRGDSVDLMRQVYEIRRDALGEDHPTVAAAASNYAGRLGWAGRHEEAVEMGEISLAIRRRVYGEEHVRVAFSLESLGWSKVGIGEADEGQKMLEEALAMRLKIQGESSNFLRVPLRLLGYIHRDAGRYEIAEQYFDRQLKLALARESEGQANEGRGNALSNLAKLYTDAGWTDRALRAFPELLEVRIEEAGMDHRHTKEDAERYADFLESVSRQTEADGVRTRFSLTDEDDSGD